MGEFTCGCGKLFKARLADRRRGWAKSCSKSCAAIKSNRETGKYDRYLAGKSSTSPSIIHHSPPVDMLTKIDRLIARRDVTIVDDDYFDPSWDAHKEQF